MIERVMINWSVSRDVEEDVMIKVTGQSAEM